MLHDFLNSKYLKDLIKPEIADKIIDEKIADYFVLKTHIEGILLSIDVMTPNFFEEICNINLEKQTKTYDSFKYGNESQTNEYPVSEFCGKIHIIKKENNKILSGNCIKLPLFFILDKGDYIYGIPTIKYMTSKIFYDPTKIIDNNINNLTHNIIRRLKKEYPNLSIEEYYEYFLNILKGRHKFPKSYRENIINKVKLFIQMEQYKDNIKNVRKEIYLLFKENAKNDYQKADWIFPNHFDIMDDLIRNMCIKYNGDLVVCQLAVLLHDVGLVYKRESNSPEGHEKRSIEYAREVLNRNDFPQEIIDEVVECIVSTNKDEKSKPKSVNAQILRTADILSQFISIHYFAKASFFNNWEFFLKWLDNRIESCYSKLCFEDERKMAEPIRNYIKNAMELYDKNKKNYPFKINGKKEGKSTNDGAQKDN